MLYVYEMCPHCMDRLIERSQSIRDKERVNFCPRCGRKLSWACIGEQKIDDTIYKIVLNDAGVSDYRDRKKKFLSLLMRIGNFDENKVLQIFRTKDNVIFEGSISDTYVNMGLLDDFTPDIHYTVIPPFPFERLLGPFISLCPTCGNETVHRTEDVDESQDYVKDGVFCEKCNEWVMVTEIPKIQIDPTYYKVSFFLAEADCEVKQDILDMICDLPDKQISEENVTICDTAGEIIYILESLKELSIPYEVEPPFPYKVPTYQKMTDEEFANLIDEIQDNEELRKQLYGI